MNKKNTILLGLKILLSIILIDQITKGLMIDKNISVIPNFLELSYTQNTGVAFNLGAGNYLAIFIIRLILLFILGIFIFRMQNSSQELPLMIIFSGGLSNLLDMIFRGAVVDFVHINLFNFPCFNVSDICITIGIVLFVYLAIIRNTKKIKEINKSKNLKTDLSV